MLRISKQTGDKRIGSILLMSLFTFLLALFFSNAYALPFIIEPNGALPLFVPASGTITASYKVTNNTISPRNGNFVKYLPLNVSVASGGCASNFNLAPKGQIGDSCILNLTVSGLVNANDPNPHHHLFVCFPGGVTCAGTLFPLNISIKLLSIDVTPITSTIKPGHTQQYTALGHFTNGTTSNITSLVTWNSSNPSIATISNTGLATGIDIVDNPNTTIITANLGSVVSNNALLTVASFVYVSNFGNSGPKANTVDYCPVQAGGSLGTCVDTGGTGFSEPTYIALNPANTLAYITNDSGASPGGQISLCSINQEDGSFLNNLVDTCAYTATEFTFSTPTGIVVNPANTYAYVTNFQPGANTVSFCQINPDGTLNNCSDTGGTGFTQPLSIALNPSGTYAYVLNYTSPTDPVTRCHIIASGAGAGGFENCTNFSFGATGLGGLPTDIVFNNAGTIVWIGSQSLNSIYYCPVNDQVASPTFGPCTNTNPANTFSVPIGIAVNFPNSFAYVTNNTNGNVSRCPIISTGTFGSCDTVASGFNSVFGIAINR